MQVFEFAAADACAMPFFIAFYFVFISIFSESLCVFLRVAWPFQLRNSFGFYCLFCLRLNAFAANLKPLDVHELLLIT